MKKTTCNIQISKTNKNNVSSW